MFDLRSDADLILLVSLDLHSYLSQQRFHFCFETFHSQILSRCASIGKVVRKASRVHMLPSDLGTYKTVTTRF